MVKHVALKNRNLLVVNVEVPGYPLYDVHIQMGEVVVLPGGGKTKFVELEDQKAEQIKHILIENR